MFIPYKADVYITRNPISNYLVIGFTALNFFLIAFELGNVESFVLDGLNISLFSHGLMHTDFLHLFFNMFYLWIFGNAVCGRVGNATYPSIYIALLLIAGVFHVIFDGSLAVGASGAVNGIIGIFFVLYPQAQIKCVFTFPPFIGRTFSISFYWLATLWFVKDFIGLFNEYSGVAHLAHLVGVLGGVAIGVLLIKHGWIKYGSKDPDLVEIMKSS